MLVQTRKSSIDPGDTEATSFCASAASRTTARIVTHSLNARAISASGLSNSRQFIQASSSGRDDASRFHLTNTSWHCGGNPPVICREGPSRAVTTAMELLTPEQVSELAGLSLDTLAQWRSQKVHI